MTEPATPSPSDRPTFPVRFGDYELLAEIGRGGMGVIYKARQCCLDRLCAVKTLRPEAGRSTPEAEASLRAEAAAAASLDHPNIVGIYEVGREAGQLFFSMELVDGQDLGRFVRNRFLDAPAIAGLTKKIADAIAYAHGRGVLHHDLKPANVVIDPAGEPQITDFGLARRIDEARRSDPTRGAGSPNYLSPEQASARFGEPGIATDVFGLGAILYFLLTDRPPFLGFTAEDTIQAVLETDPVLPRMVRPGVSADLETICLKCLQKQPARRYASAREVADELQRFLEDKPLRARPAGWIERGRKWCRRHPTIAALGSVVALLLVLIAAGTSAAAVRIQQARQRAEASELRARRHLYNADLLLASAALAAGNDAQVRDIVQRQVPEDGRPDLRGWEWRFLARSTLGDVETVVGRHPQAIVQLDTTRDGRFVVAGDNGGWIRVWDPTTLGEAGSRRTVETTAATFALSASTNWLLTTLRPRDDTNTTVALLALPSLASIHEITLPGRHSPGVLLPGNTRGWILGPDGPTELDLPSGAVRRHHAIPRTSRFREVAFSPDGRWLAQADDDGAIRLWNLEDGREHGRLPGHAARMFWAQPVFHLAFSPDARHLASAGSDGAVRVWDPLELRLERELLGHANLVTCAAFSPDSRRLVSGGKDSFIQLASLDGPAATVRLRGADAVQIAACFTADGSRVYTGGIDGAIRSWRTEPRAHLVWQTNLPPRTGATLPLEDGEHFAAYLADGRIEIRRIDDGRLLAPASAPGPDLGLTNAVVIAVERLRDGRSVAAALTESGRLVIRQEPSGTLREHLITGRHPPRYRRTSLLTISPDLRFVAAADALEGLRVFGVADAMPILESPERTRVVVFSPRADRLAAADLAGPVQLWTLPDGRPGPTGIRHPQAANAAFSPDGSRLATVGWDGVMRLWNADTGAAEATLPSSSGNLVAAAWAPGGDRIFAGSLEGVVCVWDLVTGRETFVHRAHAQPITGLVVRDGGALVSFGPDGVLTWPVADLAPPLPSPR